MLTLDITICTYGDDGIRRVEAMGLPRLDGVRYIVSWQLPGRDAKAQLPDGLLRDDVAVFQLNSIGLSRNRNNAISHTTADLVYIADDDLILYADGIRAMVRTFEEKPELDFAAFRYDGPDAKPYPDRTFDLKHPTKGYYVTSFELCFRRRVFDCGVRFTELMGIGAPRLGAGEESNLVHKVLCRGYVGRFYPVTIAMHEGLTTGLRRPTPRVLMAEGAHHSYANRVLGPAKLLVAAYRRGHRIADVPYYYFHLMRGYFYGLWHFRLDGEERRLFKTCKSRLQDREPRSMASRGKCHNDG